MSDAELPTWTAPGVHAEPALILTLALDGRSFAHFDGLRRQYFPPERNVVPAHVTLFHALPGQHRKDIARLLDHVCRRQGPMEVAVTGLRSLGRGTAYLLDSPSLQALRRELVTEWAGWLTPQDQQRFQPHVTVQNKVDPKEARQLLQALQAGFRPFSVRGEGLLLWRYLNGPWEAVRRFPFSGTRG